MLSAVRTVIELVGLVDGEDINTSSSEPKGKGPSSPQIRVALYETSNVKDK